MNWEILIPMTLFVSIASVVILKGPIGKALADRIAGRLPRESGTGADKDALLAELEDVRYRLTEVEERMDFTERVLTRQQRAGELPRSEGPP